MRSTQEVIYKIFGSEQYTVCIKIPKLLYYTFVLLWPLLSLLYNKPLDGRATDW